VTAPGEEEPRAGPEPEAGAGRGDAGAGREADDGETGAGRDGRADADADARVDPAREPGVAGRLLAGVAEQPVLGAFVVLMLLMALGFLVAGLLVLT
jgi:hypothetical protein